MTGIITGLIILAAAVSLASVGAAYWWWKQRLPGLLFIEQALGHQQHRRTMAGRVGRRNQHQALAGVYPAEWVPFGWSAVIVSNRPGEDKKEKVVWAPTRRGARRKAGLR